MTFARAPNAHLTFEAILHEGSNAIDAVYASMRDDPAYPTGAQGSGATLGVWIAGSTVDLVGCNRPVIRAPIAYRFTPM